MKRTAKERKHPPVKPVTKVELSEKYAKWRLTIVIALIALACVAFAYAVISYFNGDKGWRRIEASASSEINCSEDFVFQYNVGVSGMSASAENKALISLYSDATVKAWRLFNSDATFDDMCNIYSINAHPNEVLTVDTVLYQAFELLELYQNRNIYLGPVYEMYDNLFYCQDDSETISYDPYVSDEVKAAYAEMAAYAQDTSAVNIELLGGNQIRLNVSEEYLAYAKENYITKYIDFYWMKNAFIIDYLADTLLENGYTLGHLSSFDGFVRNLDNSGSVSYGFNLYNREGNTIYSAAVMNYIQPISIVYLRNYQMNQSDSRYYYEYKNGDIRTSYLSVSDGTCKSSINNLVSYSGTTGCAKILLQMLPDYIADTWTGSNLSDMSTEDIYTIYFDGHQLIYNDSNLDLTDVYTGDDVQYTTVYKK